MPAGKLIVDCGGVLSHQTSGRDKYDGRDIYKSAVEGAYAFVQKFIKKNGANNIHVLSRVNYISSDHWVVRFCRTLGFSPNHVTLVNDRRDKGPAALQLGCAAAIDDQSECLWWIAMSCHEQLHGNKPLFLFSEQGYKRQGGAWDDWVAERVTRTSSWKDLALCLGLDLDGWDELSGLGPPHYPHSEDHVLAFFQKLQRCNSLAASASYTEESPEPSSVDFGRDSESEVSAELKRNKQGPTRNKNKASKSKKAKAEETPLEPVSEEKPAEQLDNARETTSKKEDEAPGNVAASATAETKKEETPEPAAPAAPAQPPAAKASKAAADQGSAAAKKASKNEDEADDEDEEESEDEDDDEEEETSESASPVKVSLVLAEGADPSKAAAAAADLFSQPKGFAVKSRAAPPTSLGSQAPVTPPKAGANRGLRPKSKAKADSDDPAAPAVDLKPRRSWRRHEHGRWEPVQAEAGATSPKDAASERLAHFLQQAEEAAYRAEAAAARAERASPDRPSAASAENWQGRNPASTWVQRKKARAAAYEQSGGARQTRTTSIAYCTWCRKNQPGAYCPSKLCRHCCEEKANADPQYWCEQHLRRK